MPRSSLAALALAAGILFVAAVPAPLLAQSPQPGAAPAAAEAPKPYTPVAISPAAPFNDPSLVAFRKQVAEVAGRKDRAALARLVVAQGFFWEGDKGDKADKRKSGIDNLTAAFDLNAKEGSGWDVLAGYASDETGSPAVERKGVICSPAEPTFDDKQFDALLKATSTEDGDWGYPVQPNIEVRASADPKAAVIEKLGMHFVRVMVDEDATNQPTPMLRVLTPSGKVGFILADAVAALGNDQLCYLKEAGGWKIAGFIGGD